MIETPAGDVVQVRGQACLHDEPNGVRMQFVGEAQVRFLGLGAMIERFLVDEVTRRYQMVERALQHYIDEGREMPAAPVGMTSASQVGLLTGVQTTKRA